MELFLVKKRKELPRMRTEMTNEINEIRAIWEEQPEEFPVFLEENPLLFPKISSVQKKENEALTDAFSKRLQKKLRQKPEGEEQRRQQDLELESDFMDFLKQEKILSLSEQMNEELLNA